MDREESIASHSPSRAECPELPSAAILTTGQERLLNLLCFLLHHRSRLDNPLSDLQNIVTMNPAQSRDKLYSQVFRIPKDANSTASLGTTLTALLLSLLKTTKKKKQNAYLKILWKPQQWALVDLPWPCMTWILDCSLAHPEISDLPSGHLDCNYSWCQSTTKLIKTA